jgi:hypothetical protein
MATSRSDGRWQRLKKSRRAAVYRAIGRAARDARESGAREVAADVRIAIDLLRAHARGRKQPAGKRSSSSATRRASR